MNTKITLLLILAFASMMAFGQRPIIELTFTAVDSATYAQLDSIKVMNRTQGGDTVLYWPDTVLNLYYVGLGEASRVEDLFQVRQNYPNPVTDRTTISLIVPEKDEVGIIITDILGRVILKTDRVLDKGIHSFRFTPGGGNLNFFTAQWKGMSSSIKILQTVFNSSGTSTLEYAGSEDSFPQLKATEDIQSFFFNLGDKLLYIGYANGLQSGMLDVPEASQSYTFQFATNLPCPGTPTVEYEGQVYNTIQIFSQCWLKENLNVGTMIPGEQEMSDDGVIEKYCYDNDIANCATYGGLYDWHEAMQYVTTEGAQGICPSDWHIPTDEEWKVLEGAVDSQYGIGNLMWDESGYRGFDAGLNLKSTWGWYSSGNGTDLFGFSGLPGGGCNSSGLFGNIGEIGPWWSTREYVTICAWYRALYFLNSNVCRDVYNNEFGMSVRCIRDY
ncbi:MAG: hypothetical protein NT175_03475 [Bacteroidetes bacterium]|nr:hypothetical protein [Bacteroidota bacterium]